MCKISIETVTRANERTIRTPRVGRLKASKDGVFYVTTSFGGRTYRQKLTETELQKYYGKSVAIVKAKESKRTRYVQKIGKGGL